MINPVAEVTQLAKANGSLVLVDASQSVGHLAIDVRALGCDFLVFSGHKMLAPSGIGVLYVRSDLLEQMRPVLMGGGSVKRVNRDGEVLNDLPWAFEAGTPNIEGAIALAAAIDYLDDLGFDWIADHDRHLVVRALERLSVLRDLELFGPDTSEGGRLATVSFGFRGIEYKYSPGY